MRKIILNLDPNDQVRAAQKPMFQSIISFEILEMLRMDYEEGVKIGLMECTTKDNISLDDAKLPENIEILNILKNDGSKYTCIVKVQVPDNFRNLMKEFKLDVIYTTPTYVSEERLTYSCIGDQENITKFISLMKKLGTIGDIQFQKAFYEDRNLLSVLTDKQRDVLITAHRNGYYDYPRKIESKKLAEKVNLSKQTMFEHLRKAEGRILNEMLAGYC